MGPYQLIGYPLFFIVALEVILGIMLLRNNHRSSPVIRAVAAFSFFLAGYALCGAVMYVRASRGLEYNFFTRASWIGWFSIPAALQFIFYLKDETGRSARTVGRILYPFWLVVYVLTLFTDLVEPGHLSLIPYAGRSGPLENPARFIGAVMILWIMYEIYLLRRQVSGIKKAQLNYFFHGTLIFAGCGAFMVGFLQVLGGLGFDPALGAYFSLPWVALTFYAITRYRLFDIRIIISRALSIVFLLSVFSAAHVGFFKLFEPLLGATPAVLLSLALIAFLFFGTPVSRRVQERIQRMVVKGKYDYQQALQESIKAIVTKLDLSELLTYIIDIIKRNLGVQNICLFLRNESGQFSMRHGSTLCRDVTYGQPLEEHIAGWMRHEGQIVVREELEGLLAEEDFGYINGSMKKIGAELAIPLLYKGELQGVLTMGHKGSGEPYVQSDLDLLEAMAGHVAVAIENARLYDEARQIKASLQESEERFHNIMDSTLRKYLSLD